MLSLYNTITPHAILKYTITPLTILKYAIILHAILKNIITPYKICYYLHHKKLAQAKERYNTKLIGQQYVHCCCYSVGIALSHQW